jgi:hypothetical protein
MKSGSWSAAKVKETLYSLSPLLSVATILLTVAGIIYALKLHATEWQGFDIVPQYDPKILATKLLSPRIRWGTSLFVFYVAFIALIATSIAVIWRSLGACRLMERVGAIFGLGVVSFIVCSFMQLEDTSVQIIVKLIDNYLKDCSRVILYASWSGAISVIFAVGAACFILFSPKQKDEDRIVHMVRQTTELRILLYISSLMLVAGIFEIKTLFTYLSVQVLPEDSVDKLKFLLTTTNELKFDRLSGQASMVKEVSDAVKTAAGCVFTALLVGMYLPAALTLDRAVDKGCRHCQGGGPCSSGIAATAAQGVNSGSTDATHEPGGGTGAVRSGNVAGPAR